MWVILYIIVRKSLWERELCSQPCCCCRQYSKICFLRSETGLWPSLVGNFLYRKYIRRESGKYRLILRPPTCWRRSHDEKVPADFKFLLYFGSNTRLYGLSDVPDNKTRQWTVRELWTACMGRRLYLCSNGLSSWNTGMEQQQRETGTCLFTEERRAEHVADSHGSPQ